VTSAIDVVLNAAQLLVDLPTRARLRLRRMRLLRRFGRVGRNFVFDPQSLFNTPELLEVGDDVFIGPRAYISAEVRIGNRVMFGPDPTLIGGDHYFAVRGKSVRFMHPKGHETIEPVIVEDETWCGASVIVLGGVTLGMGCVVGAGSVVTNSVPPYTVAAGTPCRPVRRIFTDEALEDHLTALGSTSTQAKAIVARRIRELSAGGWEALPVVDRTARYREFWVEPE
jgi:acetyltransferase-like isoleucine patch superfamily enzyme